jgi:hypothetical protein
MTDPKPTIREASRPSAAIVRVAADVGVAAAVTNILIWLLRWAGVPEDLMGDASVIVGYLVLAAFSGGVAFLGKIIRERDHTEKKVVPKVESETVQKVVTAVGQAI